MPGRAGEHSCPPADGTRLAYRDRHPHGHGRGWYLHRDFGHGNGNRGFWYRFESACRYLFKTCFRYRFGWRRFRFYDGYGCLSDHY